jgi:putative Ca2+/H+ antiporter (TMEM165/GDT1 family)
MPNHVHAIFHLYQNANVGMYAVETSRRDVSTGVAQCIPLCRLQSGSLGAVVNHIKSACTKRIRAIGFTNFAWQAGYHDRIIRSDASLYAMRKYILANPRRWGAKINRYVARSRDPRSLSDDHT